MDELEQNVRDILNEHGSLLMVELIDELQRRGVNSIGVSRVVKKMCAAGEAAVYQVQDSEGRFQLELEVT